MVESTISEKITNNAIHVKGLALKAGISRNNNLYTTEWMNIYKDRLLNAPMYIEHVRANNAIGKVTNTHLVNDELFYEADVFDDAIGEQIRQGLISNVSIGFDYKTIEDIGGKHYYPDPYNAELSLVAVPGIRDANITVESVDCHICESAEGTTVEPFAGYKDFADCVAKNSDKADPKAYCGTIMHKVEDKVDESAEIKKRDDRIKELEDAYAKVTKTNEEIQKNVESQIKTAKIEATKQVISEIDHVIPHEYISNKWGLGAKRFLQDVRKVTYNKAKECNG